MTPLPLAGTRSLPISTLLVGNSRIKSLNPGAEVSFIWWGIFILFVLKFSNEIYGLSQVQPSDTKSTKSDKKLSVCAIVMQFKSNIFL